VIWGIPPQLGSMGLNGLKWVQMDSMGLNGAQMGTYNKAFTWCFAFLAISGQPIFSFGARFDLWKFEPVKSKNLNGSNQQ